MTDTIDTKEVMQSAQESSVLSNLEKNNTETITKEIKLCYRGIHNLALPHSRHGDGRCAKCKNINDKAYRKFHKRSSKKDTKYHNSEKGRESRYREYKAKLARRISLKNKYILELEKELECSENQISKWSERE